MCLFSELICFVYVRYYTAYISQILQWNLFGIGYLVVLNESISMFSLCTDNTSIVSDILISNVDEVNMK